MKYEEKKKVLKIIEKDVINKRDLDGLSFEGIEFINSFQKAHYLDQVRMYTNLVSEILDLEKIKNSLEMLDLISERSENFRKRKLKLKKVLIKFYCKKLGLDEKEVLRNLDSEDLK